MRRLDFVDARTGWMLGATGLLADSTDPRVHARLLPELSRLDRAGIRRHAAGFGHARFAERMTGWVGDVLR